MKFSGCGTYRNDTFDYDEYKAIQYVFNELETVMTAFEYMRMRVWYLLSLTKQFVSYSLTKQLAYPGKLLEVCSVINSWLFVYADTMVFLYSSSHKNTGMNKSVLVLILGCLFPQNQSAVSYFAMFLFSGYHCI